MYLANFNNASVIRENLTTDLNEGNVSSIYIYIYIYFLQTDFVCNIITENWSKYKGVLPPTI